MEMSRVRSQAKWHSHTVQDDAVKKKEVDLDLCGQVWGKNPQVVAL